MKTHIAACTRILHVLLLSTLLSVTATATERVKSITVSPTAVAGGVSATATVTLFAKAPSGGVNVILLAGGPVTVPTSFVIPANATTGKFTVGTSPVAFDNTLGLIEAFSEFASVFDGTFSQATLAVNAPRVSSVTLSSNSVVCGSTVNVTVNLATPAPAGFSIGLTSTEGTIVPVPASVQFKDGAKSATVSFVTGLTISDFSASISASSSSTTVSRDLLVTANSVNTVKATPAVNAGAPITVAITMNGKAPSGGLVVIIGTADATTSSFECTVPAGKAGATFLLPTKSIGSDKTDSVFVAYNRRTVYALGTTAIKVPKVKALTLTKSTVNSGGKVNAKVTLSFPLPFNFDVDFYSDDLDTVPSSTVTVLANQTSANFVILTNGVTPDKLVNCTASANGSTQSVALTVTPAALTQIIVSNPSLFGGAEDIHGTVYIGGVAPAGGTSVHIVTDNAAATPVLADVIIPQGSSSTTFDVATTAVATKQTITISASCGGVTKSKAIFLLVPQVRTLSFNPSAVNGGTDSTATITLSSPAPVGGWTVSLSSDDSHVTYDTTPVTIGAGDSSIDVTVHTSNPDSTLDAHITAADATQSAMATLTVIHFVPLEIINFYAPSSMEAHDAAEVTITLSAGGNNLTLEVISTAPDILTGTNLTFSSGSSSTFGVIFSHNDGPQDSLVQLLTTLNGSRTTRNVYVFSAAFAELDEYAVMPSACVQYVFNVVKTNQTGIGSMIANALR